MKAKYVYAHYQQSSYSLFNSSFHYFLNILKESLSLLQFLSTKRNPSDHFYFTIFKKITTLWLHRLFEPQSSVWIWKKQLVGIRLITGITASYYCYYQGSKIVMGEWFVHVSAMWLIHEHTLSHTSVIVICRWRDILLVPMENWIHALSNDICAKWTQSASVEIRSMFVDLVFSCW